MIKNLIRHALASRGYVIRHVGHESHITGVDLWRDANVVLRRPSHALVVDVGANTGQTIDALRAALHDPHIVAFEPSPNTVSQLRKTHGDKATIEAIAVGDRCGTATFHVTQEHSVNDSILTPTWQAGGRTIEIPITTIDAYAADHGWTSIDILKIDAQGYDLHVLHGATELLKAKQIRCVTVEVMFVAMYQGQPTLGDFITYMAALGYSPLGFYDQMFQRNRLHYLNAAFVPA